MGAYIINNPEIVVTLFACSVVIVGLLVKLNRLTVENRQLRVEVLEQGLQVAGLCDLIKKVNDRLSVAVSSFEIGGEDG